ncbi:MAG: LicD family protein [Clostridia bacterium]|nr:LicD family protein [Clostridia bacterium]
MASLYKAYDPETLAKLQKLELGILKEFDRICTQNGIEYFCAGGTAIGAMRHGGFIPWDDDIDVALLREDYERFLKCAREQLSDRYEILNTENDPAYPLMTTRLVLKGTRFQEECFKDLSCDFGIFLDVYCFDYIPDDEAKMKKAAKKVWLQGKLMILAAIDDPVLYIGGFKAAVVKLGSKVAHGVLRLLGVTPGRIYRSVKKVLLENGQKSKRVAYQFDPQLYTSIIDTDDIFPIRRIQFEDMQVMCMAKVEAYLSKRYGDYMTLPPEEKRHNHPPYRLDFGPYGKSNG